jgi:hypothetical protein
MTLNFSFENPHPHDWSYSPSPSLTRLCLLQSYVPTAPTPTQKLSSNLLKTPNSNKQINFKKFNLQPTPPLEHAHDKIIQT